MITLEIDDNWILVKDYSKTTSSSGKSGQVNSVETKYYPLGTKLTIDTTNGFTIQHQPPPQLFMTAIVKPYSKMKAPLQLILTYFNLIPHVSRCKR